MKGNKRKNVCERNFDGRFSEEFPWRVVQQITSDEDHDCFRALSINSPLRVVDSCHGRVIRNQQYLYP